jgi:hypothetical protein
MNAFTLDSTKTMAQIDTLCATLDYIGIPGNHLNLALSILTTLTYCSLNHFYTHTHLMLTFFQLFSLASMMSSLIEQPI